MIATGTRQDVWQPLMRFGSRVQAVTPFLFIAAIGMELALLTAFLPETADRFLHGPTADFHNLYTPAHERELPGLYSPFLVLFLQPLAWLPEMAAYRVFFAVNLACVLAISLIAQGAVRSWEARSVAVLAPIALPQVHWALRLGHLTPIIALVALLALLSLHHRPTRAAMLFALLSLKPQYLIAPAAYLMTRRQWRTLGVIAGTSAAMAAAGLAAIGPGALPELVSRYLDWGPNSSDNLLPIQQSWMISWPGVQISLGSDVHPLLTIDLILLSLGVAVCAWLRIDRWAHAPVVALMLIPLTPYAQFYDGLLVLVAIALLLRAGIAPAVTAMLCGGLYAAAVATQSNVVFPVKDVLGPAHTHGFYWLTPAMLAAVAFIAVFARRTDANPRDAINASETLVPATDGA